MGVRIPRNLFTINILAVYLAVMLIVAPAPVGATDGHILHGVGPVNQSMGGAGMALCVDALGSIAWNPACAGTFQQKSLDFSVEIFVPWRSVSSTVPSNSFGPGFPPVTLSGTTESATNQAFLPNFSYIHADEGKKTAFQFGFMGTAGFGVEYPGNTDLSNPITSPQPPEGLGFGTIDSNYALMKMPIGFSRRLTEKLTVGASAVPALGMLKVTPAPFAAPVVDPGTGFPYYLSAEKTSKAMGLGFNAGLRYQAHNRVSFGFAYHSPIWFRHFNWETADRAGQPHDLDFRLDVPAMVAAGVGIGLTRSTQLAVDGRWSDYESTEGFKRRGFRNDGSVAGFGWRSIWTVATGLQQKVGEKNVVRLGYNWSQNPIESGLTFINVSAPAIIMHRVSAGFSRSITPKWTLHLAAYHAFRNEISGPYMNPAIGAIPGTQVSSRLKENSISFGFSRGF